MPSPASCTRADLQSSDGRRTSVTVSVGEWQCRPRGPRGMTPCAADRKGSAAGALQLAPMQHRWGQAMQVCTGGRTRPEQQEAASGMLPPQHTLHGTTTCCLHVRPTLQVQNAAPACHQAPILVAGDKQTSSSRHSHMPSRASDGMASSTRRASPSCLQHSLRVSAAPHVRSREAARLRACHFGGKIVDGLGQLLPAIARGR